jgi:hypothetical protein
VPKTIPVIPKRKERWSRTGSGSSDHFMEVVLGI